ncbi:damage-inducible protein DinB [Kaistella flava (ex Peng et al. 2021)]|uniref:Damage-inducible protein DinB n=1 Tax=Kaistella flava (ex Peng et al. 2021) TaxID=2038776 RepID=A0A7M2YCH3_9FLAO|nr:DinB family protein [Kaistella flava (ex Peng et al. 2021)]QOW11083.1 damage-inducible protein DinB [Kaistella flava (ex Peng et al. 2021)]
MESLPNLRKEFDEEYETTKKFFDLYPEGKNDYRPHEKSMKMMPLATHVAEIFGWPETIMKTDKLDFAAGDYKPTILNSKAELQQKFEEDYQKTKDTLEHTSEQDLSGRWSMNMGEKVIAEYTKYSAMRHALNQITHHRAQLGVYYRLNDIPVPGSYGPSADEQSF